MKRKNIIEENNSKKNKNNIIEILNKLKIEYDKENDKIINMKCKEISVIQNNLFDIVNNENECKNYLKEIDIILEDFEDFKIFMLPIWIYNNGDDNGHYGDSLCKCSLDIEKIQINLVEKLFNKILEYSYENEDGNFSENCTCNLILSQLKWTNFHGNTSKIIDIIFEYLPVFFLIYSHFH